MRDASRLDRYGMPLSIVFGVIVVCLHSLPIGNTLFFACVGLVTLIMLVFLYEPSSAPSPMRTEPSGEVDYSQVDGMTFEDDIPQYFGGIAQQMRALGVD